MVEFRLAQLSDLQSVLLFMPVYYEYDGHPYDPGVAEEGLKQLLSDSSLGEGWLIFVDGQAVGYFVICFSFSLECGGREAFIDELFILESHRKRGFGKAAVVSAMNRCTALGIKVLRLEVTRENSQALRLYEGLGFRDLGRYLLARHLSPESV